MLFFDIDLSMFWFLFWMIWGSQMRAKFVLLATSSYPCLTLATPLAHLGPPLLSLNPIMENLVVWELHNLDGLKTY